MTETQKNPLTALAWALQYIEDDHHEDLANDAYARGVLADAREALCRVEDVYAERDRLREFADELAAHPSSLGDSWRVNDICIHCWALRLLGQDYAGLHD